MLINIAINFKTFLATHKQLPKNDHLSKSNRKDSSNKKINSLKPITKEKKNIEDVRKELLPDKNKTNINLKRLLALSQNTITPNDANKVRNLHN